MSFEPLMYLGILIISAKLLGEVMHRIGQPTIIGNVLAGIIVGPALFALVDPTFDSKFLKETNQNFSSL